MGNQTTLFELIDTINDLTKKVEILEQKINAVPVSSEYRGVRERLMDAQKEARTRKVKEKFDERQLQ